MTIAVKGLATWALHSGETQDATAFSRAVPVYQTSS
jgi:O-acetylhomoserine/O-acetylserine sulfhydrylase-like pyridoxal-dependent enzyme